MINTLSNYLYKVLFIIAMILIFLTGLEWFLNLFNMTLSWFLYSAYRFAEFGIVFILYTIALLLRQIRDELKK
jgi:hypothetical protein